MESENFTNVFLTVLTERIAWPPAFLSELRTECTHGNLFVYILKPVDDVARNSCAGHMPQRDTVIGCNKSCSGIISNNVMYAARIL